MCSRFLCERLGYVDRDETGTAGYENLRHLVASSSPGSSSSVCLVDSHGHDVHSHEAVLFPFIAVLIGCILTYFPPRYKIFRIFPYTVWLFIIGVLIGIMDFESKQQLGNLSESIRMWANIDPHLLLYTFLPVLLFGDSMNIKYYDFKRCAMQCTILAGPGVIAGTGLMYLVAQYIFPYDWTTNEAAAFAAILSATDPVAVVALLNEMGASQVLTMQIAGESLLNDGMAIVVWTLFFDMMMGKEYTFLEIVLKFCRLAIGGVAFGVVVGIICLRGLSLASDKLIHSDHLVQLALTFTAAYLAFFIGENELKVSGVLATIFAALTIGRSAWPVMCSPETVKAVWHTGEFFGNTILFALCGMVFYQSTNTVDPVDWLWLLLLYASGIVARGILFVLAYPLLNLTATSKTTRVTWREIVVMTWGGLRGAVGLAMALSMRSQLSQCGKKETGDRMVFFVGGFAGLTLLINASTCGMLLEILGLTQPPETRERLLCTLQQELLEIAREECRSLIVQDKRFAACNVEEVDKILVHQNENALHKIGEATQAACKKAGLGIAVTAFHDVVKGASAQNLKKGESNSLNSTSPAGKWKKVAKAKPVEKKPHEAQSDILMIADPSSPHHHDVEEGMLLLKTDHTYAAPSSPSTLARPQRKHSFMERVTHIQSKEIPRSAHSDHWWWGFEAIEGLMGDVTVSRPIETISPEHLNSERHFYLSMLRAQYEMQLREDLIPVHAEGAMDLQDSIDRASDLTHDGLRDWDMLQKEMLYEPRSCVRHFLKIAGSSPYSPYAPVYTKFGKKFDLFTVVVFLDAHHLVCARLSSEKTLTSTSRRLVVGEAAREVEEAHKFLIDNEIGAEKISIVRTKQLLAVLYARQRKQVYRWMERGIIHSGEAEELIQPVHHSMKEVKNMSITRSLTRGGEIGVKPGGGLASTTKKSKHSNLPGVCSGVYATLFGGAGHKVELEDTE